MAVIVPTTTIIAGDGSVYSVSWAALTTTNTTGTEISAVEYADRSVQVLGTFGVGGSITIQGSNDGANWVALTDPQGNAITKTAASIEAITELTRYIRPIVTAGDGTTSLTAVVVARRANPLRT